MTTHNPAYKRNYASEKPRKPRKDKGYSRLDYARLLSGYTGNGEDGMSQTIQPETTSKKDTDATTSLDATLNAQDEERSRDVVLESKEIL